MKKTLLTFSLITAVGLIGGPVFAKPANKKESESKVAAQFLEQILNSIETAAIDVNIKNMNLIETKDEKTDESKTEVKLNDVTVNGMLSFGSDWNVDLMTPKESTPKNSNMEKIYPKLNAGAKNLELGVAIKKTEKSASIRAEFYSGYNSKTAQWEARPLVINIANQMNKSLLKVRLHSLTAETRVNPKNPKIQEVSGTCKSDKILLDLITGLNKQVEVNCVFKGVMTENGYNLNLTWENKK